MTPRIIDERIVDRVLHLMRISFKMYVQGGAEINTPGGVDFRPFEKRLTPLKTVDF